MRATITNLSNKGRDKTVLVTFPTKLAKDFPGECTFVGDTGHRFRAVKCPSKGDRVTPFRIFTSMNGSQTIKGELRPEPLQAQVPPFKWHKWTADDLAGLIPDIGIAEGTTSIHWTSNLEAIKLIEASDAHQRWWIRKTIPDKGIVFEFWADFHHDDPVLDFWGKVVWSDRNDPKSEKMLDSVYLRAGEYLSLDFAKNYGASVPIQVDGKWVSLLATDIMVKDGSGLPLSGQQPTFVGPRTPAALSAGDPDDDQAEDNRDWKSLLASLKGPVVGVCHEWNGEWVANQHIPRRSDTAKMQQDADQLWSRFEDHMAQTRGWYADRLVGIGKEPGTTGDQDDFGAAKGTYTVSALDPKHIMAYRHGAYVDVFRGVMHYEDKQGKLVPLKQEEHPGWVTWSSDTHYHPGVSPDRLGKTEPSNGFGNEYIGYDDQHRSQNYLAAYYALTDDPLALDIITHQTNVDMASYRMRYPTYGNGAARAQGRLAGAWANFYALTDGELKEDIKALLDSKWTGMYTNSSFNTTKPVAVLGSHGPDGRKPIFNSAGELLPTWSIWEHALAAVGLYNAYKADDTHPNSKEMLTKLFEMIATHGCFEDTDGWWMITDMWYRGGDMIPGDYNKQNDKFQYGRGGVATWVLAAMIGAADFLPEGDLKTKAKRCANYFTNNQEATSSRSAEWWCIAPSVDFLV